MVNLLLNWLARWWRACVCLSAWSRLPYRWRFLRCPWDAWCHPLGFSHEIRDPSCISSLSDPSSILSGVGRILWDSFEILLRFFWDSFGMLGDYGRLLAAAAGWDGSRAPTLIPCNVVTVLVDDWCVGFLRNISGCVLRCCRDPCRNCWLITGPDLAATAAAAAAAAADDDDDDDESCINELSIGWFVYSMWVEIRSNKRQGKSMESSSDGDRFETQLWNSIRLDSVWRFSMGSLWARRLFPNPEASAGAGTSLRALDSLWRLWDALRFFEGSCYQ